MIKEIKCFETTEELEQLTGLSHDELWKHGFNLDDMDWGFEADECYVENVDYEYRMEYRIKDTCPIHITRILEFMLDYCVGINYTEYNGKHYYTQHHA